MNRNRPLEERVQRAVDSTEVEKVLATHNWLHAASKSREEWGTVWSRADDTSWAHSFGRMRGFAHIWAGHVVDYDKNCIFEYKDMIERYPEVAGMDYRGLYTNAMHTLTNGVLEIAEDGKTARAAYLTPGLLYKFLNDEPTPWGMMLWERYGMDFRKENGEWKFLHYQVCPEFVQPFDMANAAEFGYMQTKDPERFPHPPFTSPDVLDDPGPLHIECTPVQPVQDTVPYPRPYETMDNEHTYTKFPQYDK